jgi:hypothetical protein
MKQAARAGAYSFNARRRDLRRRGVDAVHYGVELSATSASTSNRATQLDTVIHGVETSYLDVVAYGVDPRGPKLILRHLRV